jgi:hypothetical protein
MLFIFDTNSLRVLGNYYPEQFPSFWERFEITVEKKEVFSVREVYNEIVNQIKDEWYLDWLKKRKEMFLVPGAEEGQFVAEIFKVAHFQQLVGEEQRLKGQPVADPFVVACAKVCNGTVVTEESVKDNAAKIPNVCKHFNIKFTDVRGFLEINGWKF